jgi:putative redox protein
MQDITVSFSGGKRVDAQLGAFTIKTDQPVDLGGQGAAPAPYDLFLASLATCAGIYVLGFCQARNLDTSGIALTQHVEWDADTHLPSRIQIEIALPATFPEKYRAAVVRAAEGCKVKKTLAAPPAFEVRASSTVAATDTVLATSSP